MAKNLGIIMKDNLGLIKREVFYWLTTALVIFIGLEILASRMILAYFNLNWLILLWLVSGLVLLKK